MRISLFILALLLGVASPLLACRKDDGTTPSPTGPVQPSASPQPSVAPSLTPN